MSARNMFFFLNCHQKRIIEILHNLLCCFLFFLLFTVFLYIRYVYSTIDNWYQFKLNHIINEMTNLNSLYSPFDRF